MKRKIISAILIIIGIGLLAYPKAMEIRSAYLQKKIISEWQATFDALAESPTQDPFQQGEPDPPWKDPSPPKQENQEEDENLTSWEKTRQDYIARNMMGMLTIGAIDLHVPILKGATKNNLDISIAYLTNTGAMGQIGNFALAGHNNYGRGKHFNRINELEPGTPVEITDGENTYTYLITEKFIVEPTDVYVLDSKEDVKEITLITCHPFRNPTHRLIVKGIMEE